MLYGICFGMGVLYFWAYSEFRLPVFSDYLGGPALQSGSVFMKSGAVAFSAYGEVCD